MKNVVIIFISIIILVSCKNELETNQQTKIEGTWRLLYAQKIIGKDTTFTDFTKNMKGVKIINNNHFAFFQHDLQKGQDSLTSKFSSGGGKYVLEANKYTEFLEYCSARKWEANQFSFTVLVKNDSLLQTGIEKIPELGVERKIIETYVRIQSKK